MIRGWMGISLVPPTQEDVLQPRQAGVIVADVLKNGPAAEAGIKVGDRIVKVNNEGKHNERQGRKCNVHIIFRDFYPP